MILSSNIIGAQSAYTTIKKSLPWGRLIIWKGRDFPARFVTLACHAFAGSLFNKLSPVVIKSSTGAFYRLQPPNTRARVGVQSAYTTIKKSLPWGRLIIWKGRDFPARFVTLACHAFAGSLFNKLSPVVIKSSTGAFYRLQPPNTRARVGVQSAYTTIKKSLPWGRLFLMVLRDGIEPPTRGFSVLCSTD